MLLRLLFVEDVADAPAMNPLTDVGDEQRLRVVRLGAL
jgi:hypothetical protein